MLTKRQAELLAFIVDYSGGGVSPSFEEMKEHLRLKSKSGVHRLVTGLEERGMIRKLPNRARAIEVVRIPGANDFLVGEKTAQAPNLHVHALSEACDAWEWLAGARLTEAGRMAVAAAISAYQTTMEGKSWKPPYYPGRVPEERVAEIMKVLEEGPIA